MTLKVTNSHSTNTVSYLSLKLRMTTTIITRIMTKSDIMRSGFSFDTVISLYFVSSTNLLSNNNSATKSPLNL